MNSKTKTITITAAGVIGLAVLANIGLFGPDPGVLTATGLMLAIAPVGLTEEQLRELQTLVGEIRGDWIELKSLPAVCKGLQEETTRLREQVTDVRNLAAARGSLGRHRAPVFVSEACARHLAAQFVAHCQKSGKLEALSSASSQRDSLLEFARHTLNLSTRAALTTSDMPLPTQYGTEIRELISEFGVARKRMFPYPIGMGTARPARMGTRPAFGSIDLSAAFGEKSPSVEFASLESHKIGGMGQFLARYGAVEFARAEDTWAFLADGGAGYEGVKGVVQTALENEGAVVLAATKTKPRDATLDDFRALRRKVDKGALNGRLSAYYLDTTWETRLPAFRTAAEPNVYQRLPDGSASLDGYPIVWTDVLEPFGTAAAPGKPLAVFGALSFWWLAEHGTPRMDTSEHVWFANDQLAVRFIEEIDFDYAAQRATAALVTAAV